MPEKSDVQDQLDDLDARITRLEAEHPDVKSGPNINETSEEDNQQGGRTHETEETERDSAGFNLGTVMAWAGSVILGLGFIFLISYAISEGWIPLNAQVGLGVLLGSLVTIGGHWLHSSKPLQGSLLAGVGLVVVYFSVFAGHVLPAYQLATGLSYPLTAALLILTATVSIALSLRQDSGVLLVESIILVYLTATIGDFTSWLNWFSLAYTGVLMINTAYLAHRREWQGALASLGILSAMFTFIIAAVIEMQNVSLAGVSQPVTTSLFIAIFSITFLTLSLLRDNATTGGLTVLTTYGASLIPYTDYEGVTLGFAALFLALYAFTARESRSHTSYLVGGIALLAAYVPLQFDVVIAQPVWAVMMALVAYLDGRQDNVLLQVSTHALGVAAFALTVLNLDGGSANLAVSAVVFLAYAFTSLVYASAERFEAHPYYLVTTLVAVLGVWQYLSDTWFTVGVGVVAAVSLLVGQQTQRLVPRYTGVAVLGFAVVKLFVVDTLSLSPELRIVSYVVLGVIMLGMSLFFTRQR